MSDSLQAQGLQPTRLPRPWDFPGKSTGVGCHCLLPSQDLVFFIPKSGGFLKEADIKGKFLLPEAYTWHTLLISATGTDVESTCLVLAKPPQRHQMVHGAPMSLQ